MAGRTSPLTLLWLQAAGCGGCTMSALGAEPHGLVQALAAAGIRLVWHPSLSEESGSEALAVLEDCRAGRMPLDILCVEGAVLTGPQGTGRFQILAGSGRPMRDWVADLAHRARHVVAVGSCSAFGVLPDGWPPGEAVGLQYGGDEPGGLLPENWRGGAGGPVINLAGCAPHPGWIVETLMVLALEDRLDLDDLGRPRFFAAHLAHHGCARNEYYEYKASAAQPSQLGCLMENLGCKATQAVGDCNMRAWNGDAGSCTNAGFACVNCTAPGFLAPGLALMDTPKIAGIPVGLPVDMPKAWFVALSTLSKSATPDRVSRNARQDKVVVPPGRLRR